MKKYIFPIFAGLLTATLAFAQSTLYQNFIENWGYFPSIKERTPIYAEIDGELYKGTAEQNKKLNEHLFTPFTLGGLASPPSTVEGTTTAGWTDDGSIVRLNTAADSVGIGTVNPQEKLSVVGGNTFISGTLILAGGTFTFGNGSATSTFTASGAARVGLGTTTPGALFSIQGNALTSGTSTAGGLIATSTVDTNRLIVASTTRWGDFTYHPPVSLGGVTDVLRMRTGAANSASLYWDPVSSVNDWVQVGTVTNASGSTTMAISDFTGARHIKIIVQTAGMASAGSVNMRFNRDSGANYAFRVFDNNVITGGNEAIGATEIGLAPQATTSPSHFVIEVANISGTAKLATYQGSLASSGAAIPFVVRGAGNWNNTTAQITTVQLFSSINFNANTVMTVYRSSN